MSDLPSSPEPASPTEGPPGRPLGADAPPAPEGRDAGREAGGRPEEAPEEPAPADLATLLNSLAAGLESGSVEPGSAHIPTDLPPPGFDDGQLHAGNERRPEQKEPARLQEWQEEQQSRSERREAATEWNSRAIRRAQLAQPGAVGDIAREEEKQRHPAW